ncbi:HupE/UreJ family protein [Marinobacter confluentis]|uniref:HupE/UreJ family protein n=1 Tax=Marinobacter confluentis TaxID=1697557 RepID=A0A4Z1C9L3_9GAMM|nr:HupE/UreJ family protein [Marinobacter confluentis]TGN40333.1 HupE/UreJ family protein [Marinobacter confluentis]
MNTVTRLLIATGLILTATTAAAHTGHGAHAESGFLSGLLHPMLGLDHLLAMAAIGFWSVRQNNTMKNATPVFVIGGMILGAGLAWGGLSLPGVEMGITFSVLVAGILIATLAKIPTVLGGSIVGAFMLFHGFAHGTEMPAGVKLAAYLAGFSIVTLAVMFFGRVMGGLMMKADSRFSRGVGGVLAVVGGYLAAA